MIVDPVVNPVFIRGRVAGRGRARATIVAPVIVDPVVNPVVDPVDVPIFGDPIDVPIEQNDTKNIEKCVSYFIRTYLEGSCFPVSFWNHFKTEGPRTNNNVEGYNNKLKVFVGAAL